MPRVAVGRWLVLLFVWFASSAAWARQQTSNPGMLAQHPSPMIENTRAHERLSRADFQDRVLTLTVTLPRPVQIYVPRKSMGAAVVDLLVHFHGADFVVQHAVRQLSGHHAGVLVNLGAGSSAYGQPFADPGRFGVLLDSIQVLMAQAGGRHVTVRRVWLSGFSAGYGAIRAILREEQNWPKVDGILLLDGLHADYIPDGRLLAEGGQIDSSDVAVFMDWARLAATRGSSKRFLITHSEIFPGTYASTTEVADFILQHLALPRKAVLRWGPLGMQQLSVARRHRFEVQGYAGNTGPDHVDHLHALGHLLRRLQAL